MAPVRALPFVSLDELRTVPELENCRLLAKGNRLSVIPLTDDEFDAIVAVGQAQGRGSGDQLAGASSTSRNGSSNGSIVELVFLDRRSTWRWPRTNTNTAPTTSSAAPMYIA